MILTINPQPDDVTCGPTCLHAVYRYYQTDLLLSEIINDVKRSVSGGTLASTLGQHALKQGYEVTLYVNNLHIFDPTWFESHEGNASLLIRKLKAQTRYKRSRAFVDASNAYINYLSLGGRMRFCSLSLKLLTHYFEQQLPIITGLSATYLYRSAREHYTAQGIASYDDIRGTPCGHFVVLCGYDTDSRLIMVADPHRENPLSQNNYYHVSSHRLINAIMLGVLTYDANLLIIKPKDWHGNDYCHG